MPNEEIVAKLLLERSTPDQSAGINNITNNKTNEENTKSRSL